VKWIVLAAVVVLVALIEVPMLRGLFNLGPISLIDWGIVLAAAAASIVWFEIYKTKKTRALARV
jgi:hypothetical protein